MGVGGQSDVDTPPVIGIDGPSHELSVLELGQPPHRGRCRRTGRNAGAGEVNAAVPLPSDEKVQQQIPRRILEQPHVKPLLTLPAPLIEILGSFERTSETTVWHAFIMCYCDDLSGQSGDLLC